MTTDPSADSTQKGPRPRTRISPAWWVLLLALTVWNVVLYLPAATPQVEISYSEFLDQLDARNVAGHRCAHHDAATVAHASTDDDPTSFGKLHQHDPVPPNDRGAQDVRRVPHRAP